LNIAARLICAAALLSASPAQSEAVPRSGSLDNRVRTATYVENQVFVIETDLRHSTTIHFGQGERFDAVIVGDTESFQVDPIPELGNVLTIKPHVQGASTNMTVITNRRTYSFHLREGAIPGRSGMFFEVRFRYPEDERRAAAKGISARPTSTMTGATHTSPFQKMAANPQCSRQTTKAASAR